MLGRRQLRAKAMQALYAYYRGNTEQNAVEINMMKGIQEIDSLYKFLLELLIAVKDQAENKIEIGKNKNLPTQEEANPNYRFVNNPIFSILENNKALQEFRESHNEINWNTEDSYPVKIVKAFTQDEVYKEYMEAEKVHFSDHKKIILYLYEEYIAPNEELTAFLEDYSLNWADDMHIANTMVVTTIKQLKKEALTKEKNLHLLKLVLDVEHLDFTKRLVRQSIRYEESLLEIIKEKASNWEVDRIALIDRILLQMALAEFLHFPSIPPKVTINEYLEIAKAYSTPKSQNFINGVLDNALKDLQTKGEIIKSARGLM